MNGLFVHLGALWFAVGNLRRRYLRSLAIFVPLTIAMTVAVAATLVSDGIGEDGRRSAQYGPDWVIQRVVGGELAPVQLSYVRDVLKRRVDGSDIAPRVWGLAPAPGEGAHGALTTVVGVDWSQHGLFQAQSTIVGRWPSPDERGVAVVGAGLASMGRVSVGQTIHLSLRGDISLQVVGMISPNSGVFTASSMWVHPDDARLLFGLSPGEATDVTVSLPDEANAPYLAETVILKLPDHRLVEKKTVVRHFEVIYGKKSAAFWVIWLMLILVVVSLAFALGMDTAATERREMALLKVLGWPPLLVVESRVFEAALVGAGATITGFGLGGLWAMLGAPGIVGYFVGWAQVYPGFLPPLAMQWGTGFVLVALGTLPLMAAVVIPAWRVGVVTPDDGLRG